MLIYSKLLVWLCNNGIRFKLTNEGKFCVEQIDYCNEYVD